MKLNDDHYNMILGAVIVGIILFGTFFWFAINGKLNQWGTSDKEFCEQYAHESVGKLHEDCLMKYPELR